VTEVAGKAPNESETATANPRLNRKARRRYCVVALEPSDPFGIWPQPTHAPLDRRNRRHDNIGDFNASPVDLKISGIGTFLAAKKQARNQVDPMLKEHTTVPFNWRFLIDSADSVALRGPSLFTTESESLRRSCREAQSRPLNEGRRFSQRQSNARVAGSSGHTRALLATLVTGDRVGKNQQVARTWASASMEASEWPSMKLSTCGRAAAMPRARGA
jgi:hypothetical protein